MSADDTGPEVRVRVPASSANLGPGFDVLAVAVDLHIDVLAAPYDGRRVIAAGEGTADVPDGDDNLVWRAMCAFCDAHGAAVPQVTLYCTNEIPLQRGLGSSAAAAVAGLALARRLTQTAVGNQVLIDLAAEMEGHADNAAAAVLGGLVVAGGGTARRFEPSRSLRPILCVPEARSSTSAARRLLPEGVAMPTVVDTVRRSALVLAGLTGIAAWDPAVMHDVIHEPPRLEAMPGSQRLIDAARDAGLAACLSGAGPAVLVVVTNDDHVTADRLATIAGGGWRVEPLRWDRAGARVDARTPVGSWPAHPGGVGSSA